MSDNDNERPSKRAKLVAVASSSEEEDDSSVSHESYDFWANKLDEAPASTLRAAADFFMYLRVLPPSRAVVEARLEAVAPKVSKESLQLARDRISDVLEQIRNADAAPTTP